MLFRHGSPSARIHPPRHTALCYRPPCLPGASLQSIQAFLHGESSRELSLISGHIVTTRHSGTKPKPDADPAAPPSVTISGGSRQGLQLHVLGSSLRRLSAIVRYSRAPALYSQCSVLRHIKEEENKRSSQMTRGDFISWFVYDTFHLKTLSWNVEAYISSIELLYIF